MRRYFVALIYCGVTMLGCAFALALPEAASTCHVRGEDAQCGSCVAARCETETNGCCGDKACDPTITLLESCSEPTGSPSCASFLVSTPTTTAGASLQACVRTRCGAFCQTVSGTSKTSCREPTGAEGVSCACVTSKDTNDVVCSTTSIPQTLCCAPTTWPEEGQECQCLPLNCLPTETGCTCSLLPYRTVTSTSRCSGGKCCVNRDVCSCGPFDACAPGYAEVSECSIDVVACGERRVNVASCSLRSTP